MEATTYVILDGPLAGRSYTLNEDLRAGDRHTFPVLSDPSVYDNPAASEITDVVYEADNPEAGLRTLRLPDLALTRQPYRLHVPPVYEPREWISKTLSRDPWAEEHNEQRLYFHRLERVTQLCAMNRQAVATFGPAPEGYCWGWAEIEEVFNPDPETSEWGYPKRSPSFRPIVLRPERYTLGLYRWPENGGHGPIDEPGPGRGTPFRNPAVWRLTGYVIKFDNEGRPLWNHYLPSSSLCSPRLSREDSALYAACRRASAR